MTSSGAPTDDAKASSLRARLLDEAMMLLERGGSVAITLRSLAAAAGVSHMAPYRHFRDKEALLASLAERGFTGLGEAMQSAAARRGAAAGAEDSARAALLGFGLAYLDFARARPELYRLMFGPALANKPEHTGLQAAGQATFAGLSRAVAAALRRHGGAEGDDVADHAVATWALVHGLAMLLIDGRLLAPAGSADEAALVERVLRLHGRCFLPDR